MATFIKKVKLLIIDEIGYRPLDALRVTCFFQVVSERYERGSILLTSNKSHAGRGSIFQDNVMATAVPGRLLHHAHTINIKGEGYRLKDKRKAWVIAKAAPLQPRLNKDADHRVS